jgi:hypothetical protein
MAVEDAVLGELEDRFGTSDRITVHMPSSIVRQEDNVEARLNIYGFSEGNYVVESIFVSLQPDSSVNSIDQRVNNLAALLSDEFVVDFLYDKNIERVTTATLTRAFINKPDTAERYVVTNEGIAYMRGTLKRNQKQTKFTGGTLFPFHISANDLCGIITLMKKSLGTNADVTSEYREAPDDVVDEPRDVAFLLDQFQFCIDYFQGRLEKDETRKLRAVRLYPTLNDASVSEVMFLTSLKDEERNKKCYEVVIDDGYVVTINLNPLKDGYTLYSVTLENLNDVSDGRVADLDGYLMESVVKPREDKKNSSKKEGAYGLFEGTDFFESFVSTGDLEEDVRPAYELDVEQSKVSIMYGKHGAGHKGITFDRKTFLSHMETILRIAYR